MQTDLQAILNERQRHSYMLHVHLLSSFSAAKKMLLTKRFMITMQNVMANKVRKNIDVPWWKMDHIHFFFIIIKTWELLVFILEFYWPNNIPIGTGIVCLIWDVCIPLIFDYIGIWRVVNFSELQLPQHHVEDGDLG